MSHSFYIYNKVYACLLILAATCECHASAAAEADSTRHWGVMIGAMPGKVLATDQYVKKWLQKDRSFTLTAEWQRAALPADSNAYAADYGYPTLSAGAAYTFNHGVKMRRYADIAWGQLVPVDFDSRLGNTLALYFAFNRPLWRNQRFEVGYMLGTGLAWSSHKYDPQRAPDNELIGSHVSIHIAASVYALWRFSQEWALRGEAKFTHYSNGALNRPNKGTNAVGPTLGLVYAPYYEAQARGGETSGGKDFRKRFYLNFSAGVGAKTLLEEWNLTQFRTDPSATDYRTSHFRLYAAYSFQADFMYRYARRWASGIGADVFYGSYADRVAEIDAADGAQAGHCPWSAGLAVKHQAYYGNLSVAMALGVYLYRRMGANAKIIEKPYYERVGLHYTFPRLGGMEIGINVKAHLTKADLTEFVVTMPVQLGKSRPKP